MASRLGLTIIETQRESQAEEATGIPLPPSPRRERISIRPIEEIAGYQFESLPVDVHTIEFSICVPCYKRSPTLTRLLASLPTNFPGLELIVSTAGDTIDEVQHIINTVWDTDLSPIVVATPVHYGIGSTRNLGVMLASKPWTVTMDSDDEMAPFALESIAYSILKDPNVDVLYGDLVIDGKVREMPEFESGKLDSIGCYMLGLRCFRTSLLQHIRFAEHFPFSEDLELLIALEDLGARFRRVPRPLTIIHKSEDGITRTQGGRVGYYAQRARERI
jgi:glycosyltransferase involved in cell wall biosynthesis